MPTDENDAQQNTSFGQHIQQLRRDSGLTQRQAATALEIDFTYLSKLENDRGDPPGEATIRRMAELYGADPEELLARAGKVPTELREKAQSNQQFASFLRRLPNLPDETLQKIYRNADMPEKSK